MLENEKTAFIDLLRPNLKTLRIDVDAEVYATYWKQLSPYPLAVVAAAMDRFMSGADTFISPGKIATIIRAMMPSGRPTGNEAWGIALESLNECITVVTNDEIMEALSIVRPQLDGGDTTGARVAFRDAYERIVERNRDSNVRWWPSYGTNPEMRLQAVSEAVEKGLLPATELAQLPAPESYVQKALTGGKLLEFKLTPEQIERNSRNLQGIFERAADKAEIARIESKIMGKKS